jgi:phage shock protein A
MGLLQRIGDLLRSNINDLISRAEDPERMLNAAIEDMQRQLVEAKSRVAMSIADEKRLQKQADGEHAKAEDWESKAMSAVRAGRDDLAVEALARKKEHEAAAQQFQDQLDSQQSSVDELKRALSELSAKLDDTKRRRTLLLARAKRAEAQRQLAETLNHKSHSSAVERLEVLEARIEQDEARAEANWEIAANSREDAYERDLAAEIDMLGAGDGNQELAALKARVRELDALTEGDSRRPALGSGEAGEDSGEADETKGRTSTSTDAAETASREQKAAAEPKAEEDAGPASEDSPQQNVG